jgi:hypothetical protein
VIPVYQTIIGGPNGNCAQAAYASLLELPLDEVPNFAEYKSYYRNAISRFLLGRGFYPFYINHDRPGELMTFPDPGFLTCGLLDNTYGGIVEPFGFHLLSVASNQFPGTRHSIIGKDGFPYFDPNPNFVAAETEYIIYQTVLLVSTGGVLLEDAGA